MASGWEKDTPLTNRGMAGSLLLGMGVSTALLSKALRFSRSLSLCACRCARMCVRVCVCACMCVCAYVCACMCVRLEGGSELHVIFVLCLICGSQKISLVCVFYLSVSWCVFC